MTRTTDETNAASSSRSTTGKHLKPDQQDRNGNGEGGRRSAKRDDDDDDDDDAGTEDPPSSPPRPIATLLSDLFDPARLTGKKPYLLVPEGSLLGKFDWVPRPLRVGPWSVPAVAYLTALTYLTALAGCYFFFGGGGSSRSALHDRDKNGWSSSSSSDHHQSLGRLEYPAPTPPECIYNALACLWMAYVLYSILSGPAKLGLFVLATFTVQSWALLTFRHGVCALACIYQSRRMISLAEWIRFPALCSPTVTFVVWNFAVAPFIYFVGMKTPQARKAFLEFTFSFRLVQIHVFNLVFCALNGVWACPPRVLQPIDLYLAVLSIVLYMLWYFFVLDRIGVHLYPVFSPRTGLVVVSWTVTLAVYVATFLVWRRILRPTDPAAPIELEK